MRKEIIICILVVLAIVVLNMITQNYTKKSIETITDNLQELKVALVGKNEQEITKIIESTTSKWKEFYSKLAYFIEHDELEKVDTNLVALQGFIEVGDFETGVSELNKSVFVLEHIAQKYTFNLVNIF